MPQPLKLRILENDRVDFEIALPLPVDIGRQRNGEPDPYAIHSLVDQPSRVIIARPTESNCSRKHVRLAELADGRIRVVNGSQLPLSRGEADPGAPIPPGGSADLRPPFSFVIGSRTLTIFASDSADDFGMQSLDGQTVAPGAGSRGLRPTVARTRVLDDEAVGWLRSTINVLQSAVGSADFLAESAAALVQILGLHSGHVLLRKGVLWEDRAAFGIADDEAEWKPSRHVLDRLYAERKTFMKRPAPAAEAGDSPSLVEVQGVVAAPLLDAAGNVIGALYGERRRGGGPPIFTPKIEAMLVELLACGVAAGLSRQEHQAAALQQRVLFGQFFGKELAEHLRIEPQLLEGREAEVTLLFCDVRGYSKVSEYLGPATTVQWIYDVMTELSRRVLAERGVVVDYIGDELFAMWGAPETQPAAAERAARAALAMRDALADLNARWRGTLKGDMDVGIGLNTGPARVGNTGSKYKFKYGPLGNSVNLASRVQGLTKYLKCRPLVTAATRAQLGPAFIARRVCKVRVVNIQAPVDLYEIDAAGSTEREDFFRASEAALDALEKGEFANAARRAAMLLDTHSHDGPLLLVLSRASTMLMSGGPFDPVWEPPGK